MEEHQASGSLILHEGQVDGDEDWTAWNSTSTQCIICSINFLTIHRTVFASDEEEVIHRTVFASDEEEVSCAHVCMYILQNLEVVKFFSRLFKAKKKI